MGLQSSFESDLKKEQRLSILLDVYYKKYLKHYTFKRIHNLKQQLKGIDVIFTHKTNGQRFFLDEKAQLDYINEDLPTFAFELSYQKNGELRKGWLFDPNKKTDFYSLITGIYSDDPNKYTSCKITFVNREKLIGLLKMYNLTRKTLDGYSRNKQNGPGKIAIKELNHRNEGYLYFSSKNKAEKPINLILKLDFLMEKRVAKRL